MTIQINNKMKQVVEARAAQTARNQDNRAKKAKVASEDKAFLASEDKVATRLQERIKEERAYLARTSTGKKRGPDAAEIRQGVADTEANREALLRALELPSVKRAELAQERRVAEVEASCSTYFAHLQETLRV